jgi:hypothetical protein
VGGRDAFAAALVFLALLVLYAATLQQRMTGDGASLSNYFFFPGAGADYPHLLYVPATKLAGVLLGWIPSSDPILAPKLLSAICVALGCAATVLIARALGAGRAGSVFAALLVGVSPHAWFFGTTVEVHALHFAIVAWCGVATLLAPWDRPGLATLSTALLVPLLFLSHQTGALLGLGWVGLAQVGCARRGVPLPLGRLLLGVAVPYAAAMVGALLLVGWVQTGTLALSTGAQGDYIGSFYTGQRLLRAVVEGWLVPLGLLIPLGLFGFLRRPPVPWSRAAVGALLVPQLLFVLAWGVLERGGYFLSTSPFAAGLGVCAIGTLGRGGLALRVCAVLALVLQGYGARDLIRAFDTGYEPAARVAHVEASLGDGARILSAHPAAPRIELYTDAATELPLGPGIADAFTRGVSPEASAELSEVLLAGLLQEGPLALDLSYRGDFERPETDERAPYLDALERLLADRFVTRLHDHPSWPLLEIVELRRD